MRLTDRTAVVTGGGSGLGMGLCMALARRGNSVVVADIEKEAADRTAAEVAALGVESMAFVCDVADHEAVVALADAAWARFGSVGILCNNAGVSLGGRLVDARPEDFDWVFGVNVKGMLNGSQVFGSRFAAADSTSYIVNTASEHSLGVPHVGAGLYTASKHAVLGLTDVLRREMPHNVQVSLACPGIVSSRIHDATRNRPSGLGGRGEPNRLAQAVLAMGMDPLEAGEHVIVGVEDGEYMIFTHSHSREYADERYREIIQAFERQAPRVPGDERYKVANLVREARAAAES